MRTNNPLPVGASITTAMVHSGTPVVNQLTVVPGYSGASYGLVPLYHVPPVFAVQNQVVDSFTLIVQSPVALGLGNRNNYMITVNSAYSGLTNSSTGCLAWNATAAQVESALTTYSTYICLSPDNCVSVTRIPGSAATGNAQGYTYTVYLESSGNDRWAANQAADLLQVTACASGYSNLALFSWSMDTMNTLHTPITSTLVPLADPVSGQATVFRGASVTRVPLYKVNGNSWSVQFDTTLGDVPPLTATPTKYLSTGTQLAVYDNVVQGQAPLSTTLGGLLTGVQYQVRMQTYTRGPYHGYSPYSTSVLVPLVNTSSTSSLSSSSMSSSSVSSSFMAGTSLATPNGLMTSLSAGVPSQPPPAITNFVARDALAISEVQQVAVYGSRVLEVQTITTTADAYSGVQEIILYTPTGYPLAGNFTLRFPEVQTVEVRSSTYGSLFGAFQLTYSAYSPTGTVSRATGCLDLFASASDVKAALEAFDIIDTVEVVKSGYGGYTDYFGYTWTVSFTGNQVAGNVQLLQVSSYGSEGNGFCANSLPSDLVFIAATVNPPTMPAVGLDSEVQVLNVTASSFVAQGQYTLSYNGVSTGCLNWDASSDTVRAAILANIPAIDDVYIERSGTGTSVSAYGYVYSVYFTGNYVHTRSGSSSSPLPMLMAHTNTTACAAFKNIVNGVLVPFTAPATAGVVTSRIRSRGYHLNAAGTSVAQLQTQLAQMPSFVMVEYVQRSLSDDGTGFVFTLNFDVAMGRAPAMVCGQDTVFGAISGSLCSHFTVIEGNAIGGHFIVGTSALLPFDVSAVDMQNQLSLLSGMGNVSVARTGPSSQGGYTWTVTYLTALGDQPSLAFANLLTGYGTSVQGATLQNGNFLNGTFKLGYNGVITPALAFNLSASALQTALLPLVGATVVKAGSPSPEGGNVYTVTFTGLGGDLSLLTPYYTGTLQGSGAVVNVREARKGALASGSSLALSFDSPLYCSQSQVLLGTCGASISTCTVEVYTSRGIQSQVLSLSVDYSVQVVRTAAPSLEPRYFFDENSVTGAFQLAYNGYTTGRINAQVTLLLQYLHMCL